MGRFVCFLFALTFMACGMSPTIDGDPNSICHVSEIFDSSLRSGCNVRWPAEDLPLVLVPSSDALGEDLGWSVDFFNETFGMELVTLDQSSSGQPVEINLMSHLSNDNAGYAYYEVEEGWQVTNAGVNIKKGLSEKANRLVIPHELGHIFGMLHTETPSIMSSVVTNRPFLDEHVATMALLYR